MAMKEKCPLVIDLMESDDEPLKICHWMTNQ